MPGIVTLNLLAGISWCLHNVLLNASVEAEQSGSYDWNLKQQQL